MQNTQQTKTALVIILLGGLFLTCGGVAGFFANPSVVNWGFVIAVAGGILLSVFALLGLLSKQLFAKLSER